MSEDRRPSDEIHGLPSALSEIPYSPDFVMQAIEILPVVLRDGTVHSLKPAHAPSLVVGWPAGAKPEEIAARALERLGLQPIVLHSTSWRHAGKEATFTYLAVVDAVVGPPPDWETVPIRRAALARGDTTAPPLTIDIDQVLEHALRHLAWLLADDAAIAAALPEWPPLLTDYVPEPFRALAGPPTA